MAQCYHGRQFVKTLMEAQTLAYKMNGQYIEWVGTNWDGTEEHGYLVQWDWH